jgi:hypothetical protein
LHTFPNGLPRAIDLPTFLATPLPGPRRLNKAQRQQLLEAARGILLCGLRETGPVTHVDPDVVELVDHPLGSITWEERVLPDFGTSYREYVVQPGYRVSFQFAKRIHDVVLRFGVKESSGGVGADLLLWKDRVELSADVYDFTYGSWPDSSGIPNVQLSARVFPWRNVYLEGGLFNVANGARYGYVTGFAGGGFSFDDDDLKYVLGALPISP